MRKILLLVFLLSILVPLSFAWDNTYTAVIDCSTYAVTGLAENMGTGFVCNIASTPRGEKIRISRILISNSENTQAQTVTFYDNCNSSNTVTVLWKVQLSSNTTNPVWLDFTEKTPLIAENGLIVRKGVTASVVTVDILYW